MRRKRDRWIRVGVWLAGLVPAMLLVVDGFRGRLGANPIETITDRTGWWTLALLAVTLSVTPLRRLAGWRGLVRHRRTLGLTTFVYAALHLATYVVLDLGLDLSRLAEDVLARPFITVGFVTWLILAVLALTSTDGWIRRLGPRWRRLHRWVYAAAALGTLHFFWSQKADRARPLQFAAVFAVLLALRLVRLGASGRPSARVTASPGTPTRLAAATDPGAPGPDPESARSALARGAHDDE
ncbi:MAG: protein-methionine-sulfoxide reductase heme-binding subunit MsrQ [Trueperaceae bacterium]